MSYIKNVLYMEELYMAKLNIDGNLNNILSKIAKIKEFLSTDNLGNKIDKVLAVSQEELKRETPIGITTPDGHINNFTGDSTHLKDHWVRKVTWNATTIIGIIKLDNPKLEELVKLLEDGSPKHLITPKNTKFLKFYVKRGGSWVTVFSKGHTHPGFKSNKFTDRAEVKHKKIADKFSEDISKALSRLIGS